MIFNQKEPEKKVSNFTLKRSLLTFFCFFLLVAPQQISAGDNDEVPIETEQNSIEHPQTDHESQGEFNDLNYDEFFKEQTKNTPDNFYLKLLNMLFVLGLLIAFMIIGSWMIKRMMRTRLTQMNVNSQIKIIDSRPLQKAVLHLVEANGKRILIAESVSGVTFLATIHYEEQGS